MKRERAEELFRTIAQRAWWSENDHPSRDDLVERLRTILALARDGLAELREGAST